MKRTAQVEEERWPLYTGLFAKGEDSELSARKSLARKTQKKKLRRHVGQIKRNFRGPLSPLRGVCSLTMFHDSLGSNNKIQLPRSNLICIKRPERSLVTRFFPTSPLPPSINTRETYNSSIVFSSFYMRTCIQIQTPHLQSIVILITIVKLHI